MSVTGYMPSYEELYKLLLDELIQRGEEGYEVSEVERKIRSVEAGDIHKLEELWKELEEAEPRRGFPYFEPSSLEEIRKARTAGLRRVKLELSDGELLDRIYGAWLGRCAGCLLGKPVEGWSREEIEEYLKLSGSYPLRGYIPLNSKSERYASRIKGSLIGCTSGNITHMVRDDDIDYTILGLHILEEHGLDFETLDVGSEWLSHLPYKAVYTAERAAYRNLVNGLRPPATALYRNPYREWIGAQIRADVWGYVTPGMPELGAELAYRDASLSHVKNGIYGEMFVSAMISISFLTDDVEEVIETGLSEIPRRSRLAEAVRDVLSWHRRFSDWRDAWDRVMEKYGHYHRVHVINNAALVLLGLLYGEGDFERSITISVMSGLDTDCNGATVGSILGAMLGASKLPEKWIRPLNDKVESFVLGFHESEISSLARRTMQVMKRAIHREDA